MAMAKTKGVTPSKRRLATTNKAVANQWQNTPQQNMFMANWLDPDSPTFANAYQSALNSGYSDSYAQQISSPAINNKWIQEYTKRFDMQQQHIIAKIQELAIDAPQSRSPDDTRLSALELLSKIHKLVDSKGTTVNIVTPILGGESRKQVDSTVTVEPDKQ